jgi:heat shock protein HslJ
MWRWWAVILMVLVQPAMARDVTGILLAPPQPLPSGAELHLQLVGADGVVAEQRLPARVANPPVDVPFALVSPATGDLTLRAAIYTQGVPVWTTDGLAVPTGEATVDMGKITLLRPSLPGGLVPMICGTTRIGLSIRQDAARLVRPGTADLVLQGDGTNPNRFSDGADTTLMRLGNRATLILQGTPLPACSPTMPAALFPLRAQGVEPGWVLVADRTHMALTRADGVTAVAGAAQVRMMADGLALFAAPDMNLILIDKTCTDGRLPYPVQATLTMPGTTLRGCAGDAMAMLAGAWGVDVIAGAVMPEDDVVTMEFIGASVSGYAGCNRYRTVMTTDRTALLFARPTATKISCVGPDMQLETALLAALPRVTQAMINANGELELRAGDTVLIRAYR